MLRWLWPTGWLRRSALFVLCSWLGAMAALVLLQDLILFPGAFNNRWREPYAELAAEEVRLAGGLHAWWCAPPGWKPVDGVILYSHGNGSNLSKRQGAIVRWRRATGRAVLAYDYPGYGKSPGRPSESGCYAAAEAALAWLGKKGVPASNVVHAGESLGAAVAVEMARRHGARLLVLMCPFASIKDMGRAWFPWMPGPFFVRAEFDSIGKAGEVRCPVLVAHGSEDALVPCREGERLFAAMPGPKRFLRLEGKGHCHPASAEFFDAVRAMLAESGR